MVIEAAVVVALCGYNQQGCQGPCSRKEMGKASRERAGRGRTLVCGGRSEVKQRARASIEPSKGEEKIRVEERTGPYWVALEEGCEKVSAESRVWVDKATRDIR